MLICENNTVFAKSDFWSKTRQPAPVSPISSHADLLKTAGAEYLHIKRVKEMAREMLKIVTCNNIAPTFIENLIALKRSQYSVRNDKSAVIPRANTTKYGLNSFAHEGARICVGERKLSRV